MKKTRSFYILASIAAFLVVCVLVFTFTLHHLSGWASSKASAASGRKVSFADKIDIDWGWPVTAVQVSDLKIANFDQGSRPEMFSADKIFVSIDVKSLLTGTLALPEVTIEKPDLLLEKNANGDANWKLGSNPGGASAAELATPDDRTDIPEIGRLLIKNGKVAYKDEKTKTDVEMVAESVLGNAKEDQDLHFSGKGKYQGQEFTLDIVGGSVFQLKKTDKPYQIMLGMDVGKTKIKLEGTVLDPIKLKGLDLQLHLSGADASELFDIAGIALPPTPPYDVKGQLAYENKIWNFKDFKGKMGSSDLAGSVTWDTTKKRPLLSGDFVSQKLDFADLGGLVGANRAIVKESSTEKRKREAAADAANPYIIPDTPLDISRLSAMDAKVTFTGKELISSSLPLDDFYMKIDLDNSLLKLLPVRFGTASGDIKAFLTVNAREKPVKIDSDVSFRRLDLKPMFAKLASKLGQKNFSDGYIGGTAKLSGTGTSLRQMLSTSNGTIGLGMEGGHLSNLVVELLGLDVAQGLGFFVSGDKPTPIRCVIGDFGVKNGLMQVRQFVIDTGDSNVRGAGGIDLKTEDMNLILETFPKDSTLVSLNTPIKVQGTMKNPSINLKLDSLAARAAVAAVAAVIAAPIAAIAFIEPADGKDSPCNALLNKMDKHTGTSKQDNMIPA